MSKGVLDRRPADLYPQGQRRDGAVIDGRNHAEPARLSAPVEEVVVTKFSPDSPPIEEGVLLREMHHRVDSGVAAAINLVSAAAVRAEGTEAKAALGDVVELLHGHAELHRALAMPEGKALIDSATYLRKLGSTMRRSWLDRMNIRLAFATESIPLQSQRCWRLGLIAHELVTNAAKHACFETRAGEIRIKLSRIGALVNCVVLDNGSRSARDVSGRELRISNDLARALGGRVEQGFGAEFTSVVLSFPLTERERQANWAVATRRLRSPRRPTVPAVHEAELPSRYQGGADPLGELLSPSHRMDAQ